MQTDCICFAPFHISCMNRSSAVPRAGRETERFSWNGVVSHSVEFHGMWGGTRIAYSCFLPDTEGGRWRAKERKERTRERESSPLCDVHWCSCSSRSNAASVLCSSTSLLPSAPLNYSQPEDVQWLPPFLSPPSLHAALFCLVLLPIPSFLSHVTSCFRGSEQKFLLACWLTPPTPSTATHLPSSTHLSSLTPYLTLLLSSLLVPHLPILAARLDPSRGSQLFISAPL